MKPLSASQVELYRRCSRKWAFRYLTNLPKAQFTAATTLGTELHAANEAYNKSGTLPVGHKVNDLFMQGLPYLPKPCRGTSERRFDMVVDGIPYMGFQDWYGRATELDSVLNIPAVADYKTSSDPAKYGLQGKSDFLTHVQPLVYAREATQEEDCVYLRWIYYRTKGKPKTYAISGILAANEVAEQFHTVVQTPAKEIVRLRVLPSFDPNELAPNRAACNDFNTRCEYAAHCREDSVMVANGNDDMLAQLRALCEDDTSEVPGNKPAADPINRTGRRVSSRPPISDRGVFIEAVDPATVKKAETPKPAPQPVQAPAPVSAPKTATAIILEELSEALSRAAKRIS